MSNTAQLQQDEDINTSSFLPSQKTVINEVSIPKSFSTHPSSIGSEPKTEFSLANLVKYFKSEQSWEGEVIEILEDSFRARLADIHNPGQVEEAEILFSALSDSDDLKLIKPGAVFFWTVGTRIEGRRSEQVSIIQFRRLPRWNQKEVDEAKQTASVIKQQLKW